MPRPAPRLCFDLPPSDRDIAALQAILGHKTVSMTMRYAHMITSHLHSAMARFDAKVGTKTGTQGTVSTTTETPMPP
jgi:hypothetical protein